MEVGGCFEAEEEAEETESEADFEDGFAFDDVLEDDVLGEAVDDVVEGEGVSD